MSQLTRNLYVLAGLGALLAILASMTFYTVPETQQVIVTRFGKPTRIVNAYDQRELFGATGAGINMRVPFLEQLRFVDKRVLDLDMQPQTVLSTDQLRLVVDAFARFRIVDPLRMYQTQGSEQNVADQLSQSLGSQLRNVLGRQPFAALLSPERGELMDEIQKRVNEVAKRYGAEIVDVRIKRADLPTGTPLESALERMRTARQQEAITIRANGSKEAQFIRAEADARAAKIYSDSFGKDPDFYAFFRAMQSYRRTFEQGAPTSMVLSTDNEYLREFEGRRGN